MHVPERFFRIVETNAGPATSNPHSISRFLQQATFGPNLLMITSFPGYLIPLSFNCFRQLVQDFRNFHVTLTLGVLCDQAEF